MRTESAGNSPLRTPGDAMRERVEASRGVRRLSSSDVLAKIAEHARQVPAPKDLLTMTAAAARYSLTNLDAAKEIAAEIRSSIQDAKQVERVQVADGSVPRDVADALGV